MPNEAPKAPNRWESTKLYSRSGNSRARTVGQVREEALARLGREREERRAQAQAARRGTSSTGVRAEPEKVTNIDLVGDTEEEEEMPGCGKKKKHDSKQHEKEKDQTSGASTAGATGTAEGPGAASNKDGLDPNLRNFLLAIKDDINKTTNEAVGNLAARIDANEKEIMEIRTEMTRRDIELEAKLTSRIGEAVSKARTDGGKFGNGGDKRAAAYSFARRSVKLWPVTGDDLADSVRVFLKNELGMTDSRIVGLGEIEVSKTPGRAAKDRNEILATFESAEDRDLVKAAGVNLAGKKEVGMTIHVPGFLVDNLLVLNAIGYKIKTRHNGVKRSVKFDDRLQDIYLDICVAGKWKKITPDEAREAMKAVPESMDETRSLSISDLSNLITGEPVAGLTAVVVQDEDPEN